MQRELDKETVVKAAQAYIGIHAGIQPKALEMSKSLSGIKAAMEQSENVIEIYGSIMDHAEATFYREWFGDDSNISGKMFRDQIADMQGDIIIRINSPGGDVFEASTMLVAMREKQKAGTKFTAIVDGLAASAASIIAIASDEVLISELGFIMIHEARGGMYGRAQDMQRAGKLLEDINDSAANLYADKTGINKEEILFIMSEETYMSATDSKEQGFADSIIEQKAENEQPEKLSVEAVVNDRNKRMASILNSINITGGIQ